jgi:hypothetical protein
MNHKLLKMLNEAGFEFTPDIMAKLPAFENLVWLEREACALVCLMPVDEIQVTDDCSEYVYKDHLDCAEAIRARGQHDN